MEAGTFETNQNRTREYLICERIAVHKKRGVRERREPERENVEILDSNIAKNEKIPPIFTSDFPKVDLPNRRKVPLRLKKVIRA